ncbi:SDR family oxidoreductase [Pseudoduganella umbonata]|uniref:NAD(P)-dependent dehydrogenase (Short-subunit alcohol dehydrogenase family) n=1 Tax=Pseudoduganella umbonata TaxID=864828 RepID=A0A4P8HXB9_9BURK|nr:SDR family oxidoreductase [Pseudoduganella umbonata]MBB3223560.1 NAD(P)-dependent dehydrogenase (short-subunit alcohol dehydrogenase family) [Pseudoduganella umbonata]QCP13568.1 SDR family oxidoreductase [Pseudoduganella umbonata]
MKTILITGCSSGYGLQTARLFHERGWNVIATMRTPTPGILAPAEGLLVLPLDVTRTASIDQALELAGPIDVLVNNAGIGLFGAFEATPLATVREIFETNTFGTMAVTQAVLPQFRKRRSGIIINVTSTATIAPFPLVAAYTASKTAVEGFTESLALELAEFDVRVKLIEPGYGPATRFAANGAERMKDLILEPYMAYAQSVFAGFSGVPLATTEAAVAEAIWHAANDPATTLRYPAGDDAMALARARSGGYYTDVLSASAIDSATASATLMPSTPADRMPPA